MALIGGHSDLNINLPNNFPRQITPPVLKYLKVEVLLRSGASLKRVVTWSNEDGVLAYKSRERAFLPRNPSLTPHSCAATPLPLSQ